jgi:hypothetical protein
MRDKAWKVLYLAGVAIGSFLYGHAFFGSSFDTLCALLGVQVAYIIYCSHWISTYWIFFTVQVNEPGMEKLLYMARVEIGSFLFCSIFHILCVLLGVPTARAVYRICSIYATCLLPFLVAAAVWIYLVRLAKKILAFIRWNKFWTHGHLQLRLKGQIYDHKWAAIGTKEFRAFKFELRVTGTPVILGMNVFQSGLLQYAFATLPIELQSSEVGRKIGEISKAEMSGNLPKPKHN